MRLAAFVLLITPSRVLLVVVLALDIFLVGYNVGYGVGKEATPSGAPHQMFPASGTVLRGAPHVEVRVSPLGTSSPRFLGPVEPLSVAASEEAGDVSPAEFDLATGDRKLGSGAPIRYSGTATWYCSTLATCTHGYWPGDLIAAIDRKDSPFRQGDRVTVRAFGRAVTVLVVDVCQCAGLRLIDLSRAAFARLANPDLGVIPVTMELAGDPTPTGPPTDVEP